MQAEAQPEEQPQRADSGELVADARLAVAACGPAAAPPLRWAGMHVGFGAPGTYAPVPPRGVGLRLAAPFPSWASLVVPPSVPFGAFPAGGFAPEAKDAEAEAEPPLALRMGPAPEPVEEEEEEEPEPAPRRSSRKRKGPDQGPFLGC